MVQSTLLQTNKMIQTLFVSQSNRYLLQIRIQDRQYNAVHKRIVILYYVHIIYCAPPICFTQKCFKHIHWPNDLTQLYSRLIPMIPPKFKNDYKAQKKKHVDPEKKNIDLLRSTILVPVQHYHHWSHTPTNHHQYPTGIIKNNID